MICPNCRNDVEGMWVDTGIGPYEYWGQKCTDSKMTFVCEACDSPIETEQSYEDYLDDCRENTRRYEEELEYSEEMRKCHYEN